MKNKVAYLGVFLALALILSYVETLIPFSFGIPGVKLGLTNLIVVLMMYLVGYKEAFLISFMRILLAGMMFGNVFSILYSLAGGLLSFAVMALLIRTDKFHVITVSICGGVTHNIGQIIVASVVVESYYVMYYFPVLLFAGMLTGMLIGVLAKEIGTRMVKGRKIE